MESRSRLTISPRPPTHGGLFFRPPPRVSSRLALVMLYATGSLGSVHRPIPVDAPQLYVFRAKSRGEAEELAIGYREIRYSDSVSGMTLTRTPSPLGCAESAVVVSPDGKAYTVKRQSKTKKVMREVEEPDGSETIWTERP